MLFPPRNQLITDCDSLMESCHWPVYIRCPFWSFHNRIENYVWYKVQPGCNLHDNDNCKLNKCQHLKNNENIEIN